MIYFPEISKFNMEKFMFYSIRINLSLLFITFAYPGFSFQSLMDLYDFREPRTYGSWMIVNDGVSWTGFLNLI